MLKEVALAGLLHDIGKFYQKSNDSPIDNNGKHPKVSKRFVERYSDFFKRYVDVYKLTELVARHHENSLYFDEELLCGHSTEDINPYTWLISMADNLSSKERDIEADKTKNYKTSPLNSVFNRINILEENLKSDIFMYNSGMYNNKNIFPKKEDTKESDDTRKNKAHSREILINEFTNQMDLLEKNPPKDFYHLMIILDRLLKKHLWCIPSSSQDKVADISLYDHLKTTSAIASVLYLYQEYNGKIDKKNIQNKESKYILFGFRLTDVPSYITNLSSPKGASKQMRARSFIIDATTESICKTILEEFGIPIQNKLMVIGGECHILLPNIDEYTKKVLDIMREIEKAIFYKYSGDLYLNFEMIKIGKDDFEEYGKNITRLSKRLDVKRTIPFKHTLTDNDKWDTQKFILYNSLQKKKICTTCSKKLISSEKTLCSECSEQQEIGRILPKSKYAIFTKKSGYSLFLDNTVKLVDSIENMEFSYGIQLDDMLEDDKINLPIETRYISNYIPIENDVLTFEDIAEKSEGRPRLSLIQINVDNLLYLFKEGFKTNDKNLGSMSRVATVSRMIDMFFTSYINSLLKDEFPNIYCINSSGNNALLICPFSDTIRLVIKLYEKFNEYVGDNSQFTLSTSIVDFKSKTSIPIVLEKCNINMSNIKNSGNLIYFMGKKFTINNFKVIFNSNYKMIRKELANKSIDINTIRRIQKYSDMYCEFLDSKDVMKLIFEPLFSRDRERNYNENNISEEFKKYISRLNENVANYNNKNLYLYYATYLIKYVLQVTKKEREDG